VAISLYGGELAPYLEEERVRDHPVSQYLLSLESVESRATACRALAAVLRSLLKRREVDLDDIYAYPWAQLSADRIAQLKNDFLNNDGKAPSTTNVRLAVVRGVQRQAMLAGQMSGDRFHRLREKVKYVKFEPLPAGRYVPESELRALFAACEDGPLQGIRDQAIISAMVRAGLRRAEIVGLAKEAYVPADGFIRVLGKGRKERKAVLLRDGDVHLAAWLSRRKSGPGPHLFCPIEDRKTQLPRGLRSDAIYALLERRARAAGIPKVRPHDLRRTYATVLFLAGIGVKHIQLSLGHRFVATTLRYDVRPEKEMVTAIRGVEIPTEEP
jgi:site-specific recombinase XerD